MALAATGSSGAPCLGPGTEKTATPAVYLKPADRASRNCQTRRPWVWQVFLANVVQANVILSAAKDLRATAGDEILRCAQNDSTRRLAKNFCHTPGLGCGRKSWHARTSGHSERSEESGLKQGRRRSFAPLRMTVPLPRTAKKTCRTPAFQLINLNSLESRRGLGENTAVVSPYTRR